MNYIIDWSAVATWFAVVVALFGYVFVEWQRRQSLKDSRRVSVHMIGIRLFRLANHFGDLHRHFEKFSVVDWRVSRSLLPPVHPLLGNMVDERVRLDKEEIGVLVEMREADYLAQIMLVASRYESIVLSMAEYQQRYDELYRMTPPPSELQESVAHHHLEREDFLRLRPFSIQLFQLIEALREMIIENATLSKELLIQYHSTMKARFPDEKFISFSNMKGPERD